MASSAKPDARIISKCSVKPVFIPEDAKKAYYLTPWDIQCLGYFIQYGLVYDQQQPVHLILDRLKHSLALTLTHFFPLSGRVVAHNTLHPPSYSVYADCKDPAGAEFIHAVASSLTVADILAPTDVPTDIIESLFGIPPGVHRGPTVPILLVQVTQLADGVFMAFSINHGIADGASFWHFVNSWAEVCRSQNNCVISRPPVTKPWFLNDQQVNIPGSYSNSNSNFDPTDKGIAAPPRGTYRQRVFNFTSRALAQIKAKANLESHTRGISSYAALAALIWRSATRARRLCGDQTTTCVFSLNCRSRLEPPLSNDYFGNCLMTEFVSSGVDELLSNNFGWSARKLHDQIAKCDNKRVRAYVEQFTAEDCSMEVRDPGILVLGDSRRFDIYGNDFGWGKPVAIRASDDMVDAYVQIMPGRDGGSIDLIVCFFSEFMNAFELDEEFMGALSFVPLSKI